MVGVNVAYVPPEAGAESLGFAIPSDTVVSVADQLIEDGEAFHPYLGISLGARRPLRNPGRDRDGHTHGPLDDTLIPIHPIAWKGTSTNFACRGF